MMCGIAVQKSADCSPMFHPKPSDNENRIITNKNGPKTDVLGPEIGCGGRI
jgi:hypothetical protein